MNKHANHYTRQRDNTLITNSTCLLVWVLTKHCFTCCLVVWIAVFLCIAIDSIECPQHKRRTISASVNVSSNIVARSYFVGSARPLIGSIDSLTPNIGCSPNTSTLVLFHGVIVSKYGLSLSSSNICRFTNRVFVS